MAATLAVLALVAACSGNEANEPTPTIVTTTTLPPAPRVDDGVLRIGVLVPDGETGMSSSVTASVDAAVTEIDDAGGVLGNDLDVVFANEGATAVTAAQAIESLVGDGADGGVDAIVGPMSSGNAIGALDEAVSAGVVTCSPTASAIALDDFPDDNNLFFRTIASDSLQAVAIAQQARETGATKIGVVHVDDAYGRPYADAVAEALAEVGSTEITRIPVSVGDEDLADDVAGLDDVQVAIVLGNGTDVVRFLAAIGDDDSLALSNVIVNDAARSSGTAPVISDLPSGLRDTIIGVAPQIVVRPADGDAAAASTPFGPQIDDCVNLIALAAVQGGSDSPSIIASQMSSVSEGGRVCGDFAGCVAQLEQGLEINYQGDTGITDLGRSGDPDRARFELFTFDEDGADVYDDPDNTVSI